MPNGDIIASTHAGTLPIPSLKVLPQPARTAHIIPKLQQSLISVGALCDKGCTAVFNKQKAYVFFGKKTLITGSRTENGLWMVEPTRDKTNGEQVNLVTKDGTKLHTTITEHLRFLHAASFSPVLSTWEAAVKNNNFVTWPAITTKNIRKYMEKTPATVKGHMDQLRQNTQSTKTNTTKITEEAQEHEKTNEILTAVIECTGNTEQSHSDLTGRFPHISSTGQQYILDLYHYETNGILGEPLKSRQGPEIFRAHKKLFARLCKGQL